MKSLKEIRYNYKTSVHKKTVLLKTKLFHVCVSVKFDLQKGNCGYYIFIFQTKPNFIRPTAMSKSFCQGLKVRIV